MNKPKQMMIAGGSGFIGQELMLEAKKRGIGVTLITRDPKAAKARFEGVEAISWEELSEASFNNIDVVVNLAGAGIADKRWSAARLKVIEDSRVKTTKQLCDAIREAENKPSLLIQGSAIGFYGATTGPVDEDSPAGKSGHLPAICQAWEEATGELDIRKVVLRTGVVLDGGDGPLEIMAKPFRMFVGAPLGSGKQHLPWIHRKDLVGLIFHAIEKDSLEGPLNGVAPVAITNRAFSKLLAKTFKRPMLPLGVPGFVLKILVGLMAKELLLDDQHVVSKRTEGYDFAFPDAASALRDALG